MNLSGKGECWLKDIEKLHLTPYDDQTGRPITNWVKGATIGYGHLIPQSEWKKYSKGINLEQAKALFETDLEPFVEAVRRVVATAKRPQTQSQFDALVIFCFNIGKTAFTNSTVARMIKEPNGTYGYPTLEAAWKAWNKSQGKVLQGIVNRRAAEWDMYDKGIYRFW